MAAVLAALVLCASPSAIDGDTFHCHGIKPGLRISGIDSPELPGHCRAGRVCAPGDPVLARDNLRQILASGPVSYRVLKTDLYGRPVVNVYVNGANVSCLQLLGGYAIYKPTWDDRHIVRRECRL